MSASVGLKSAFGTAVRTVLRRCFSMNSVSGKFTSLFQSPYSNSRNRIHACDNFSSKFTKRSDVRQGFPISFYPFSFVIWIIIITLFSRENRDIDIYTDDKISDLEYADEVTLPGDDPSYRIFLNRLSDYAPVSVVLHPPSVEYRCNPGTARSRILF